MVDSHEDEGASGDSAAEADSGAAGDGAMAQDDARDEHGDVPRLHRPRRALPTDVVRPTRAEVHLSHLRHNLGLVRRAVGQTPIWAVLKADGYGHGAKAVARTLERAGVDGVCVALVEEGIELRDAGIALPILVMGGYYGSALRELSHHRLTPVLSDPEQVKNLTRAIEHSDEPFIDCHVKVDTGMARLGTRPADVADLVTALVRSPRLRLDGLMTHLASADVPDADVLEEPLTLFAEARRKFAQAGLHPRRVHMANSAAALRDPRTHFDLVRPGIALFGVDPTRDVPSAMFGGVRPEGRFKPTMSVQSRVVSLRKLEKGSPVGYGGTFVAGRKTTLATVPVGYADGLPRIISNVGSALVRGKRAPIVGAVSMDMITLDVTDLPGVQLMDEVVLLGSQKGPLGTDSIDAVEFATWAQTIPWEILTNISRRVPRFYREA